MAIDIRRKKEKLALLAPTWPITLDSLLSREAPEPCEARARTQARDRGIISNRAGLLTRNSNSYPCHLRRSTIFSLSLILLRSSEWVDTNKKNWMACFRNRSSCVLKMKSISWKFMTRIDLWKVIIDCAECRVWRVMEREY